MYHPTGRTDMGFSWTSRDSVNMRTRLCQEWIEAARTIYADYILQTLKVPNFELYGPLGSNKSIWKSDEHGVSVSERLKQLWDLIKKSWGHQNRCDHGHFAAKIASPGVSCNAFSS